MRQHIFDAQEAIMTAIAQRDASAFKPHRCVFPQTYSALQDTLAKKQQAHRAYWIGLSEFCFDGSAATANKGNIEAAPCD